MHLVDALGSFSIIKSESRRMIGFAVLDLRGTKRTSVSDQQEDKNGRNGRKRDVQGDPIRCALAVLSLDSGSTLTGRRLENQARGFGVAGVACSARLRMSLRILHKVRRVSDESDRLNEGVSTNASR